MSVYRDEKRGTWTVSVYYRDYENEVHRKTKRGFQTKREALECERNFVLLKSRCTGKLFKYFWETYTEDIKPQVKEGFVETVTCTSNHLQILDDALVFFYYLHSVNIRELFEYYTDDELALELAGLIEKLLSGIKSDRQFVEEIKKIRKKVICAGGVLSEEK